MRWKCQSYRSCAWRAWQMSKALARCLERKLGVLPAEVMEQIKKALRFALDLE